MYCCAPDVIATDLEHEMILLDPRNGEMFSLNATSRRVWLSLPSPSAHELAGVIASTFDVETDVAYADIEAFLCALTSAGLVECLP